MSSTGAEKKESPVLTLGARTEVGPVNSTESRSRLRLFVFERKE